MTRQRLGLGSGRSYGDDGWGCTAVRASPVAYLSARTAVCISVRRSLRAVEPVEDKVACMVAGDRVHPAN
jgi:hypothetical protein